jgi:hypothetical protein
MARITADTYTAACSQPTPQAALAQRLRVQPRAVYELARRLDVTLKWLDIASGPDVLAGTPASWEACEALGIDPTGNQ